MTAIAHAITSALLHFVWQGLALFLVLWAVLAALPAASARLRYFISSASLAIMVLLPVVTAWMAYRAPGAAGMPAGRIVDIPNPGPTLPVPVSLSPWIAMLEQWALPVWFAGVLLFSIRLIWSSRQVVKLRREGDAADASVVETVAGVARRMNIGRPVRVLISRLADSPAVVGWLRPVVLLPAAAILNLSPIQLEAVLAHELAHIRRHDYLVNLLQTLAETLFFYQPAVWWISSRIRNERELCCDDLAVEFCGDAAGYARALTTLERLRLFSPKLAMSSTGGSLMYRIQRLTGVVREQPLSKVPALLAVILALSAVGTNLPWSRAQAQAKPDAEVSRAEIWVDTVKFGDLPIAVRALGTLRTASEGNLQIPTQQVSDVQLGQSASVLLRRGITIAGKVSRIDPAAGGMVTVAVELQAPVPEFAGQEIDGTILIKTLNDITYVGRPVLQSENDITLFKIEADGNHAKRTKVRFGAPSVNKVQIVEGLQPGDKVILTDTSKYAGYDRIHLVN